jgi:hypothetical protein
MLAEEYEQKEQENGGQAHNSGTNKIIYDCIDISPYYEKTAGGQGGLAEGPYLDDGDLIDVGEGDNADDRNPARDFSRNKASYPYGTQNSSNPLAGSLNPAGKKINRYYAKLKPYYVKENETDETLVFESRFESGNLRRAVFMGDNTYNLILKYDHGTTNYTQWFYFRVGNTRKNVRYKFNIINLVKPDSSYNQGQKPLFYSSREAGR